MSSLSHEYLGIAIVDDDDVYRSYVSALVSKNTRFSVFEASSGEELYRILDSQKVDCIILDYNLGTESGFAVRDRLGERYHSVPPIVMLTGDGRESTVIKALRLGFNDYLAKRELTADGLISAIGRAVQRARDEQRTRAEHERLANMSGVDLVTGLLGQAKLDGRLAQLAAMGHGARSAYAIVLVEMNELHAINESFGLKAGDQALRAFGERLSKAARSSDICGRYSGSSFLIVVDVRSDPGQLQSFCERLTSDLAFRIDLNAASLDLSACIGAALGAEGAGGGTAGADLMKPALDALDAARAAGSPFKISDRRSSAPPSGGAASTTAEPVPSDAGVRPAADQLRTSDRRREPRQRVFKRGQILLPGLGATIDCTVRNQSRRGAGIRIDAPFAVPKEFELLITGDGVRKRVQVRWQIGTDLGVEYIA
ncbi:diguanylate cyclase [Bradyrhizobium sp. Pear76]|uniref:diguanylate cyclase domain-containing protein n=1 Tax=Bradyrhizobium oropedii TaxID=1571201 RepID=UPI001E591789|nr:diguanylate cyclase [Bradyrhizobium oropedii]MCC8967294.1 diguanylate cyclase [Bradyrhizobium oropedii]